MADEFVVGGRVIKSRFIHGTGKFPSNEVLIESLERSGSDMVTLAVRRLNLEGGAVNELAGIDFSKHTLLPNTAGATTADQAIRIAHLARAAGLSDFIKVEVIGDDETLLPDPVETLRATKVLADEGFIVMTYTSDDVVLAMRLAEAGAAAVMPLAAPIGTTLGVQNSLNLRLIIKKSPVPVVVDAGLGVPSDVAKVMEWGAAAVLANTAVAKSQNPPLMAEAISLAVRAGRMAFLAGRAEIGLKALASSPTEGVPV